MPSINKLTVEELLEALKGEQSPITFNDLDSVSQFVYSFNIQGGKEHVSLNLLFQLYKTWTAKPVNFKRFKEFFLEEFKTFQRTLTFAEVNIPAVYIRVAIKKADRQGLGRRNLKSIKTQIERIIAYYNLQPGKFYIEARCLFYLYDSWCYDRKKKTSISEDTFYRFCELYFPVKNTRCNKYFMVHPSIKLHITAQARAEIKQGILRAKKRTKNKTKQ